MKPLEFTYTKLWDTVNDGEGHTRIRQVIACQLTPKGDYKNSNYILNRACRLTVDEHACTNSTVEFFDTNREDIICLTLSENNPLSSFFVPAEHFEQFKQAVTEYNRKYCELPDMKVLDDFDYKMSCWLHELDENSELKDKVRFIIKEIKEYKELLEPEYFEEV